MIKNNKMPPQCVLNGLQNVPIPPELAVLDTLSRQLIQRAKCYQTIVRLGSYTSKVHTYNSLKALDAAILWVSSVFILGCGLIVCRVCTVICSKCSLLFFRICSIQSSRCSLFFLGFAQYNALDVAFFFSGSAQYNALDAAFFFSGPAQYNALDVAFFFQGVHNIKL